jgi:protein-tyrosine phosphatase
MVCLGNICRSPMAEVLVGAELAAAGLAERVTVESAGTGDWHVGGPMDRRARAELAARGLDGAGHRARQIGPDWLDRFDLLIAMDAGNLRNLRAMADGVAEASARDGHGGRHGAGEPDPAGARIRLFRSFDSRAPAGAQVPDPYGGGPGEFAVVFEMMQAAARGLVTDLAELLAERAGG